MMKHYKIHMKFKIIKTSIRTISRLLDQKIIESTGNLINEVRKYLNVQVGNLRVLIRRQI